MELKFGDIKKMDYDDRLPFEFVLVDLLYKKMLDVNQVLTCYTEALDKERHLNKMRFEEACVNLTQILSGNTLHEAIERACNWLKYFKREVNYG